MELAIVLFFLLPPNFYEIEKIPTLSPSVIEILTHFEVKFHTEPCKLAANLICK